MEAALPNIIFIVMDTAGAKHMSLYGYHRQTTPYLERLAKESMVYTRCYASSCWTIPSHASMFTGLYPSQHGAYENRFILDPNIHHLVPSLKMLGYRTLGISTNQLVGLDSTLCPGFDYFADWGSGFWGLFKNELVAEVSCSSDGLAGRIAAAASFHKKFKITFNFLTESGQWREVLTKLSRGIKYRIVNALDKSIGLRPLTNSSRYSEKIIKLSHKLLDSHLSEYDQPFFLFINFIEPHEFYCAPQKYRQFSKRRDRQLIRISDLYGEENRELLDKLSSVYCDLHDDEIYYLDSLLERLLQRFSHSPLADNTLIMVTSDHGEHLGEKGHYGHMLSLYNELIWVPLIIKFPRDISKRGTCRDLVSLNDLYATLLDLAGSPLPHPESSLSLLGSAKREFALAQIVYPEMWEQQLTAKQKHSPFSPPTMAVMTEGGLKLIENRTGNLEIYNLSKDADEAHDLQPTLSPEPLENFQAYLAFLKETTGYLEAVHRVAEMPSGVKPITPS
jgi:arylsulfatase A-like enzyme